jgi:PPP family 3-phenylpropionic acid transporter
LLPYWRLSAYYFFYFAFLGAYAPYFGLYLKSLAFSAWDIGILMSLMQVMRVIAPNLWGWLADHTGSRMPIVRVAALLSALGFSGMLVARTFSSAFAAMAVLSFFWGAALPLVEAVTIGHLGARSGGYGRIRMWGSLGFIVTVLGVGYLLDRMPIPFLIPLSLSILATVFVFSLGVPESPPERHDSDRLPIWQVVRQKEVLSLLSACFFMSAAHAAMYIFLSIFLVDHGYSKTVVGWLWSLGVMVEIGVFLFMPRLLAAFSPRAILSFSMACAVLRFLMIGWGVAWPVVIVLAQTLHGATFGANHAAAMSAIGSLFKGRHHARGQALYASVSFGAGGMVGGLISGWSWDALGGPLTYTLSSVFALVGLVILRWVRTPGSS